MTILGCINLDITLREDHPINSHENNLMIMKHAILEAFMGTLFEETITTKNFFKKHEKKFTKNDAVERMILAKLLSLKYQGKESIKKYILEMFHVISKLKALKLELSKYLFMHLVLIYFPTQFSQFKVSYNCQ
ncbi:unnamed protein product [Spirodela intermedia]|uniref:Uncharacterized protein n=2 Tax=Spirodela intermedia TaxID=51605 RepID=A0A7I8IGZ9_SPIIN|nr:unnamed protein product [Spirodela intermedia]CAA6656983.1 unnamed protein product [Spirodela intermedia]CAA7392963.1 unnamed protein product [Spirodela intermedia]